MLKEEDLPYQELKGYLQKKGDVGIVRSYKSRWFQQTGSKIYYYKDDKDKEALGFIDLTNFTLGNDYLIYLIS